MPGPILINRSLGSLVALIAIGALAARAWGQSWLDTGLLGTKPNVAVCLLALVATQLWPQLRWVKISGALVGGIALATLYQFATGTSLGLDELLLDDQSGSGKYPGGMSLETAVCLLVVAVTAVTLSSGRRTVGQALALATLVLAGLALLADVYGVQDFVLSRDELAMPSSTALAISLLALAMLVGVPNGLAQWVLYGEDAGAMIQRRLLPFVILLLPALAALRLTFADADWYDDRFGIAINVTVATAFLTAITVRVGIALRGVDKQRSQARDELVRLNTELEDRVRVRSEALERERTQVALLRDRNRIARDLHDRVIQRVFAAGLQLTEVAAATPAARDGIDDSIEQLNACIRELRETIFKLDLATEPDISRTLSTLAATLEPILGFAPELTVDGDPTRLGSHLADHLTVVTHEALINVAKHAGASHAEVRLCIDDLSATLLVTDDGQGMPRSMARDSGLANIRSRAAEVGGRATWGPVNPRGTVLTFRAPLGPNFVAGTDRVS